MKMYNYAGPPNVGPPKCRTTECRTTESRATEMSDHRNVGPLQQGGKLTQSQVVVPKSYLMMVKKEFGAGLRLPFIFIPQRFQLPGAYKVAAKAPA